MKEFLFFMANFLDFWFLPFIIALVISIVIEQIFRSQKANFMRELSHQITSYAFKKVFNNKSEARGYFQVPTMCYFNIDAQKITIFFLTIFT